MTSGFRCNTRVGIVQRPLAVQHDTSAMERGKIRTDKSTSNTPPKSLSCWTEKFRELMHCIGIYLFEILLLNSNNLRSRETRVQLFILLYCTLISRCYKNHRDSTSDACFHELVTTSLVSKPPNFFLMKNDHPSLNLDQTIKGDT